jgi:histidinol dehydrogenase
MLRICSRGDADYTERLKSLAGRTSALPEAVEAAARATIADVRLRGDVALRELTERFESRTLGAIELPSGEWLAAAARVSAPVKSALENAAARIRAFHERERHESFEMSSEGIRLGSRVTPLSRVGLYVPGGTARYPSTVLMTAIPATVARVPEIVMTTPGPSPETLLAARIAGVHRVFVIGGAQAIAALAYGTESVPRVDKIVGPGNAYVTAAKRQVWGDVGIDAIAGPTEVVIAADDSADPAWVAADLLAQAEHDALAMPILLAVGRSVAGRVNAELARQLSVLPRKSVAEAALRDHGFAVIVSSAAEAVSIMNLLSPEHAELAVRGARELAAEVTSAGAIFVGTHTPEPVGDYMAGPSHVLPTGGSARFSSPLGVGDFVKRTSVIEYDAAALERQAGDIQILAEFEGLEGHGRAVSIRRAKSP